MLVDPHLNYYIGSFRRCSFDTAIMPQCLNLSSSAHLGGFDSEMGNLFKFNVQEKGGVMIELIGKQVMFLSRSLKPTSRIEDAAVWEIVEYDKPFRGGPMDVSVQIFLGDKLLCSREKTGQVMLMDLGEAENLRDKNGDFVVNIAWELTPDCDEAVGGGDISSIPDWLRDMLVAG